MVHLRELPEQLREALVNQTLPEFGDTPWVNPKPLNECRVALVSTAGLHRREDTSFALGAGDYRGGPTVDLFLERFLKSGSKKLVSSAYDDVVLSQNGFLGMHRHGTNRFWLRCS